MTTTRKKKSDNSNLRAKLDLRRYMLRAYHADELIHVLDCCQGDGLIWKTLRREFNVDSYWGVDVRKRKGRLAIRSERILAQHGWTQNVIDIDTYDSPWRHWQAMLPNVARPTTVFLTVGRGGPNRIKLSREELRAMGLDLERIPQMPGLTHRLADKAVRYLLTNGFQHGVILQYAVEAVSDGNARYLGLRLTPSS